MSELREALARWREATAAVAECLAMLAEERASPAVGHDLTVQQLAERLGRSPSAVREWVAAGLFEGAYRLPGAKRAGAWRIPESGIVGFTDRQRPKTSRQDALQGAIPPLPNPRAHPRRARPGDQPDLSAWRKVRESRPG